jgi:hypothetical protein
MYAGGGLKGLVGSKYIFVHCLRAIYNFWQGKGKTGRSDQNIVLVMVSQAITGQYVCCGLNCDYVSDRCMAMKAIMSS